MSACRCCAAGEYNLCENFLEGDLAPGVILGFARGVGGGMAEMMAAHPSRLVRVPDHVPDEVAVLTDSMTSALQPVLDHFPEDHHTVVIYGAGIIGQHLIRLFRALGSAARLVAVARYPFQVDLAREGGADIVLSNPSRSELGEMVGARLVPTTLGGGNLEGGADFFFDCVGNQNSVQEGLLTLRCRGTYVMVGTAGTVGPVDFSSLWFRELRLTGSSTYAHSVCNGKKVRTYEKSVELLSRGDYPTKGLVSHFFRLNDYRQAFQAAFDKRRHQSMKVALDLR
jgi:threonine dehydrogenase-like Zn-dependent dehydrogenase